MTRVWVWLGVTTTTISAISCSSTYGASDPPAIADADADATASAGDAGTSDPGCEGCTSVATGQDVPTELLLAVGYLHWINTGSNASVPMRIASDGSGSPQSGRPGSRGFHDLVWSGSWAWLVDDGGHVVRYFTESSCTGPLDVLRLTPYGGALTWVWTASDGLKRITCGNSDPATLLAVPGLGAVVADDPLVWFSRGSDESISSCDASGATCASTVSVLATGQGAVHLLAIDDTRVYWATPAPSAKIRMRSKAMAGMSGEPVDIAMDQGEPKALVPRGSDLYWTDADRGTVTKAAAAGGSAAVVVASRLDRPWGLAVGADDLFVAESGAGRITKIPRR